MSRFFNGREIELLAPVGTFKDFEEIIKSNADAVYLGGKNFNMRMHRKDHNFSNEEIEKAIQIAHSLNKKVYVTFNNMMSDKELEECIEFLRFLEKAGPDALIIQDFAAVKLIKDLNLNLNIHLSVMANVHSKQMVEKAKKLGVTRVVTSREMSLETIKQISQNTDIEFEYFIHGDMCSVHGSQCLYSGMLFGKSSNRGLCMKPCRWNFKYKDNDEYVYPLAVKDMSLYRHIPELIQAGVCSFKIEGRMRSSEYLLKIIDCYSEAIDRYINDPMGYYIIKENSDFIYDNRVRDLSTAYAFKKPGAINIDISGKREPRIFSKAVEEFPIQEARINELKETLKSDKASKPLLSVKVNSLEAFKKTCDNGADILYIAGEVFRPYKPFSKKELKEAIEYAKGKKVFYCLPKMTYDRQFNELHFLIKEIKALAFTGIVVSNIGQIYEFKNEGLELIGDYGLNIYNSISSKFYEEEGLNRVTLSVEAPASILKAISEKSSTDTEIIVQGAPTSMYLEHCIVASKHGNTSSDWCMDYCEKEDTSIIDEKGIAHTVFADQYCKNHIIPTKDICYLPLLKELSSLGFKVFRIEGTHYSAEALAKVVKVYRDALDKDNYSLDKIKALSEITNRSQGLQALNFD